MPQASKIPAARPWRPSPARPSPSATTSLAKWANLSILAAPRLMARTVSISKTTAEVWPPTWMKTASSMSKEPTTLTSKCISPLTPIRVEMLIGGIIARESLADVEGVPYYADPPANTTINPYPRCINVYAWPVKLIQYDDGVHWTVLDARIRFDAVYRSIYGGNFGTGNAPQYPFALDGGRWNENRPAPVWPNNVWVRLRRLGNTFYGYHSSDGINWGINNR